jgi:HK97 family phage major capsid protein
MSKILELRRKRSEVNDKVQALAKKSEAGLTSDESAQFTQLCTEFDEITAQIEQLEKAEKMQAAIAQPVSAVNAPAVVVKQDLKQYPGAGLARIAMSIAAGKGNLQDAAKFAETEIGDKGVSMAISTTQASGGALIPQNLYSEVIELLRDRTVVRKLGARSIPLPNGNLSLPRMSGGATASYVGEGSDAKATESKFDDVKLAAKTMIALVPMSNQLIGRAGFNVEQMVLADVLSAIAVREDKAFLRDDGSNNTPKGFKATALENLRNVDWSGAVNLNEVDKYLDSLILKLMESNSLMIACGWAMSPRTWMYLFGLRDGNGNKVYPEMAQGILKGYPIEHTNAIPSN